MPTCTLACTRKRGLTHGSAPVCAQDHARTSAERDLSGGTAHNEAQGRRALVVLEICAADRAPSHKLQALVCGRDERAGVAEAQAGRHALGVDLGGRIPAAALLAEQAALLPVRHAPAAPRPAAPAPRLPRPSRCPRLCGRPFTPGVHRANSFYSGTQAAMRKGPRVTASGP